ncbi:MAG: DRTGG domain-containing protein [Bacteroidota bacterium]
MSPEKLINILEGNPLNIAVNSATSLITVVASDLMSDVLTLENEPDILITGLANTQTIRTAEMADIPFVIIAKGKKVSEEIVELAREGNISLISTNLSVYRCCGILYSNEIKDVF